MAWRLRAIRGGEMTGQPPSLADLLSELEDARDLNRVHPLVIDGRRVFPMTVSPEMRAMLAMIKAKDRWRREHREMRIAQRGAVASMVRK